MAAEISEITDSNQEMLTVMTECLRILRKIEAELDDWRPTMDRFRTPAAGYLAVRQARKRAIQANGNGQVPQP